MGLGSILFGRGLAIGISSGQTVEELVQVPKNSVGGARAAFDGTRWQTVKPQSCSAYKAGEQTLTTGVNTPIAWTAEKFDTAAMHDNVTDNTRITVTVAGKYAVSAGLDFAANALGLRRIMIKVGGNSVREVVIPASSATIIQNVNLSLANLNLAALDYVEVFGYQTSGGDLNVLAGSAVGSWFDVSLIEAFS